MIFRRNRKDGKVVRHKPKCSFGGLERGERGRREQRVQLVAGPGVYICSDCISVANDMLRGHNPPAPA